MIVSLSPPSFVFCYQTLSSFSPSPFPPSPSPSFPSIRPLPPSFFLFLDCNYTFAKMSTDFITVIRTKFLTLSQSIRSGKLPADSEFPKAIDAAVRTGLEEELGRSRERAEEIERVYTENPKLQGCMKQLWPDMAVVNTVFSAHYGVYPLLFFSSLGFIFLSLIQESYVANLKSFMGPGVHLFGLAYGSSEATFGPSFGTGYIAPSQPSPLRSHPSSPSLSSLRSYFIIVTFWILITVTWNSSPSGTGVHSRLTFPLTIYCRCTRSRLISTTSSLFSLFLHHFSSQLLI